MSFISRRSFVERLGLGAGAALLSPIARTLHAEAQGAAVVGNRKRFMVFMVGNAISTNCSSFVPPEARAATGKTLTTVKDFTWGRMVRSLEPYRSRMLLVDGFSNQARGADHTASWAALSGFSNGAGGPGGITIDQFIGKAIGKDTRFRALLTGSTRPGMFALGRGQPAMHYTDNKLAQDAVFGDLVTDGSGVNRGAAEQRLILDRLRADVRRLQAALAGIERRKLDQYLAALDEYDSRQKAGILPSCRPPQGPAPVLGEKAAPEDRLSAFADLVGLGLACGLTNVGGIAAATGHSHHDFHRYTKIHLGSMFESKGGIDGYGHDPCGLQGPAMDLIHDFHASLMARMAGTLSTIKEGDRSIFDNMTMIYLSDSAGDHHSDFRRWPVVILGNAGGKLRTDGRYLRYPDKGQPGARSLSDLFGTLATALDVPGDGFGTGGVERVQGPLSEILT